MDLGLPPEKVEVKADPEQIDLEVIQDFILSGLAPCFDDMQYDFLEITERLAGGDTYLKIAADIGMGVGVFVVMVDEYRKRVAPMAAKWDEWRKGQVNTVPPKDGEPLNSQQEEQQNGDQPEEQEGANTDSSEQTEENESEDNNKPEDDSNPATDTDSETTVDKEELEEYILKVRPNFDDIPVDFPTLLQQRREEGKTWMQIAKSIGLTSGQITTKWTAYKKMVAKQMRNGGAA
jgi:DNA-directed RNA polymerase specialized sigma24 family protein